MYTDVYFHSLTIRFPTIRPRAISTPRRLAKPLRASPECWGFCVDRFGQQVSWAPAAILAASAPVDDVASGGKPPVAPAVATEATPFTATSDATLDAVNR